MCGFNFGLCAIVIRHLWVHCFVVQIFAIEYIDYRDDHVNE